MTTTEIITSIIALLAVFASVYAVRNSANARTTDKQDTALDNKLAQYAELQKAHLLDREKYMRDMQDTLELTTKVKRELETENSKAYRSLNQLQMENDRYVAQQETLSKQVTDLQHLSEQRGVTIESLGTQLVELQEMWRKNNDREQEIHEQNLLLKEQIAKLETEVKELKVSKREAVSLYESQLQAKATEIAKLKEQVMKQGIAITRMNRILTDNDLTANIPESS